MNAARKALWYIESHYAQSLALADVARNVGLSPFHLSRLFQASTGTSLVRYLRGRRLTEAAHLLAGGQAHDILAIALGVGYTSHAAFTRAFVEQFGQTPEQVRRSGLRGLPLVEAIRLEDSMPECEVEPLPKHAGRFRIVGIGARYTRASAAAIPTLWQRLYTACSVPPIRYGVSCNGDHEGAFDYIAGIALDTTAAVPSGWWKADIPPRDYVVAWHAGHISTIRSTWTWLLNQHLPQAGLSLADAPDFERYDARFNDSTGYGGVEIWLPAIPAAPDKGP